MLEEEYKYFKTNKKELVKKHKNKFVVIKKDQVLGVFDTEKEAYEEAAKNHEVGTFLIQQCVENEEEITQTFHSRTIF